MALRYPLLAVLAFGLLDAAPSRAATPSPHWSIVSLSTPTNFSEGDSADFYTVIATNDGSQSTDGSIITVTDTLPAGVTATEISGTDQDSNEPLECSLATVSCSDVQTPVIAPDGYLVVTIRVSVGSELPSTLTNEALVSGGGAPDASIAMPAPVNASPAPFGVESLAARITDLDGSELTQAGAHPFQLITSFALNSSGLDHEGFAALSASAKDIDVTLPPGLIGNPTRLPRCSQLTFQTVAVANGCPANTQVGLLKLFFYGASSVAQTLPVYNIEPPAGESAELGFTIASFVHVPMFFKVRSDGDYGLTAALSDVPETDPVRAAILSLWGVPADPRHDLRRNGPACESGCSSGADPTAFLTLPASCSNEPLKIGISADSWQNQGRRSSSITPDLSDPNWASRTASAAALTGCENLASHPSITVAPDTAQAGAPSGYAVNIHIPQNDDPNGLATPGLRRAAITLPAGTVLSPSGANGLLACSDDPRDSMGDQFGLHSLTPASCPKASQVGTVRFVSPLVSSPLTGQLFLGKPGCSPCAPADARAGRLVRLLLQASGSGVIVKLLGSVSIDQDTGQLTTTFEEDPPLPLSDLDLSFNGGSRALMVNPGTCGKATAGSALTAWSSPFTPDGTPASSFLVGGCETPLPFAPAFEAGTVSNRAAGFSSFTATVGRSDLDQTLGRITLRTPPGLLALLADVPLCEQVSAEQGNCSQQSRIGRVTLLSGAGGDPVPVDGEVFLTGPYKGAPFGLAIVLLMKAGPLELGTEALRMAVSIDPLTSQLTLMGDPVATMRDGIPLQIRRFDLTVDRAGFMFNPTSCGVLSVDGQIDSSQGASVGISNRFQAANCAMLAFKPKLAASTQGKTSRARGASLELKIAYPRGQANLRNVAISLPRQLPSRLTTIQKACIAAVFDVNPASCPAGSIVGSAQVVTPVLRASMNGPVYLVSRGMALPNLVLVLQGQGVTIKLVGVIGISKHNILSGKFSSLPDAPISSLHLKFPTGPGSALTANLPGKAKGRLCASRLVMPTVMVGQNGAQIKQGTKVRVTGCSVRHKARKSKTHYKK